MLERLLARPAFAELPVAAHLAKLRPGRLVVQAPPGTGKTTVVPPVLASRVEGRVVVTQPRRIAARAGARRLAALSGTRPGEYAGHTVRGDSTVGAGTQVEFVTTGVLLRRLLRDPELAGVGAVVLDEVHERHLDDDLTLAMLAELGELRDDLTIVAMSATLDAERWAELLGGADVVAVPSVLHPLEIAWAPAPVHALDGRGVRREFLDHVAEVTRDAFDGAHSALVFVPGAREVDAVVAALRADGVSAVPLHGRLDARAQDEALRDDGPRVVVATAVAESSLTVPGVRLVVDSGLAREPRFDAVRGVGGLVTVRESRASAVQRAGRAARLGPGRVVRCLPEEDWAGMAPESTPEVAVADLTDVLLALAVWGSPRGEGMALPTPLPAASVARGEAELRGLGLVDDEGRVTDLGRRVAGLPLEPRLGVALLEGARRFGARTAAEVVALLADESSGDLAVALARARRGRPRPWTREAERLAGLAGGASGQGSDDDPLAWIVARARPGWVACRRGEGEYLTASGTGVTVPRGEAIRGEWLAMWDVQRVGERVFVRAAVELDEALALTDRVSTDREATFDGRVRVREVRRLGAIELAARPVAATPDDGLPAVRRALAGGLDWLPWTPEAVGVRRRLALLHRTLGEPWPDVSDAALAERGDEWLGPELAHLASGGAVSGIALASCLRRLVPWSEAGRFDELAPERIQVPSGSRIRLDYPEDDGPVVCAVKLQECFGMQATPTICDGRVRVLMHLLSPARRPLAVTEDLASFWAGPYASVRAENRGRYAKHPWPEDPLTAEAKRGTKKQGC